MDFLADRHRRRARRRSNTRRDATRPLTAASVAERSAVHEGETDFKDHLEVRDFTLFHMAAGLHDLEPAHLPQGAGRPADRVLDRVFNALFRGTCDFDDAVDMVRHWFPPWRTAVAGV